MTKKNPFNDAKTWCENERYFCFSTGERFMGKRLGNVYVYEKMADGQLQYRLHATTKRILNKRKLIKFLIHYEDLNKLTKNILKEGDKL